MGAQSDKSCDDEKFNEWFDDREVTRISSDLAASVNSKLTSDEEKRVNKILDRDTEDRLREMRHWMATQQIEMGNFQNIDDSVVGPTPEQLEKAAYKRFTPAREHQHGFEHKAYRRLKVPAVRKLHKNGLISDYGWCACRWYSDCYEACALEGKIVIPDLGREIFGGGSSAMPVTEAQELARSDFRAVRKRLPSRYLKFFDAVALHDIPLTRARRHCRLRNGGEKAKFHEMAETLYDAICRVDGKFAERTKQIQSLR